MTIPARSENVSSITTVVIQKDAGESIGIGLGKQGNGKVVITSLVPEGLASKSKLRVNMEILSVANVECGSGSNLSVADLGALLRDTQGSVTIVAKKPELKPGAMIAATITKEKADQKVGLGMGTSSKNSEKTYITSIKADSPAADSDLQVGMFLKTVNNIDCSKKDLAQIGKLLANATGTFTILAQAKEDIPVARATPTNGERPPPPGCSEGGVWAQQKYPGPVSAVSCVICCCCVPVLAPLVVCFPCDERDVYIVDRKVYLADGQFFGRAEPGQGVPASQKQNTASSAPTSASMSGRGN